MDGWQWACSSGAVVVSIFEVAIAFRELIFGRLFSQVFWRLYLHNSWASSSQTVPLERGTASKEQGISSLRRVTWPYSLTSAQQLVPSS